MPGKKCPNCNQKTFFKTATGRKCSKCNFVMDTPANSGMGGKGKKCSSCGKYKVFDGTCRGCGSKYIASSKKLVKIQNTSLNSNSNSNFDSNSNSNSNG